MPAREPLIVRVPTALQFVHEQLHPCRPILFAGPMVRAILAGRKTQTRRVMKTPPPANLEHRLRRSGDWLDGMSLTEHVNQAWQAGFVDMLCPFGEIGHRLWVRETFARGVDARSRSLICFQADDSARGALYSDEGEGDPVGLGEPARAHLKASWCPSIHMPRWASRITLEITDVRVERLQDISEEDARAEGFPLPNPQKTRQRVTTPDGKTTTSIVDGYFFDARGNFCATWEAINGKRAPWASNPWCWTISFRRLP